MRTGAISPLFPIALAALSRRQTQTRSKLLATDDQTDLRPKLIFKLRGWWVKMKHETTKPPYIQQLEQKKSQLFRINSFADINYIHH